MIRSLFATASLLLAACAHQPPEPIGSLIPAQQMRERIQGAPLTAVAITQCGLLVAVYVTMPDGRLIRIDRTNKLPVDQVIALADSAGRSERIEVNCDHEAP